jgi:hypothetical protein
MSDIKLFRISSGQVNELTGTTDTIEKSVQTFFEKNLEALLGVRFLASEFTTSNGGRIDTLGLDENGCPVILEYKRASNENVINQGLFYLDWLMDHRKDFQWLVMEKLGKNDAEAVDWSAPRLICIAGDFNRYDDHAVKQIQRNIELIRYRRFGSDLLMLDLLAATSVKGAPAVAAGAPGGEGAATGKYKTISAVMEELDDAMSDRFEALRAYLMALGDDVQETTLRFYIAFAPEGRTPDQHDAFCIAAWLARADRDGTLASFLKPDLPPPERAVAQVEGWILGVPGLIRTAGKSEASRSSACDASVFRLH